MSNNHGTHESTEIRLTAEQVNFLSRALDGEAESLNYELRSPFFSPGEVQDLQGALQMVDELRTLLSGASGVFVRQAT